MYARQVKYCPVTIIIHNSFIFQFFTVPQIPLSLFLIPYLVLALASLNIPISHFVLVWDFNVNMEDPSHHLYHKVHSLLDYFNLTQVVSEFTHRAHCGSTSLIDLVFTSASSQVLGCTTIPPLDNPQYQIILSRNTSYNQLEGPWNLPRIDSQRRNCLFQKAKRSNNPAYKSEYKRNRVITSPLRQAKQIIIFSQSEPFKCQNSSGKLSKFSVSTMLIVGP